MAALAIVGAMMSSCSEAIEVAQPANTGKTVMVKTTVSLGENATTRTLTEAGVKTFAEGDQIAVIYKNTSDETVKVESVALTAADIGGDAHNATFTVVLTNPNPGGAVRYIYPASRAATTVATDAAVNASATVNYADLATQDGTFAKASTLDLATFDGTLTDSGTLPATASLTNPLTIGKFTIKNSGGTDITSSIIEMKISDGSNTYTITPTTALSTFYVAMHAVSSSQTVILNATDGTNHYTKSVTNNTLAASNIYAITVNTIAGANLSLVTADYTAQYGEVLTGTLGSNVKIIISDGMTVTLDNVTINGVNNSSYNWAGITCEGDATIILADGSTNTVKGFSSIYPGIFVPEGKTLIIQGDGSLYASNNGGESAGIGAGYGNNCGNIEIQGGNITATSSEGAGIGAGQMGKCGNITISGGTITATSSNGAGIGGGAGGTSDAGQCGNITISGGTITATSSNSGAGIGGGDEGPCGNITITNGVTKVTATKGSSAQQCIGKGETSDCGTVTIGGTVFWQNNAAVGDGGTYLSTSPCVYCPPVTLTAVTSANLGWIIGSDGKAYMSAVLVPAGTTAVAMITYVGSANAESSPYNHGLALALSDANGGSSCSWSTSTSPVHTYQSYSSSFASESGLQYNDATHNSDTYPAFKAAIANNGTAQPTNCSAWFLPTGYQWNLMINACMNVLGTKNSYEDLRDGFYNAGGTNLKSGHYWSSTEYESSNDCAWRYSFENNTWAVGGKSESLKSVRSALAF